jgi:Flp pilus assembly protein TadG
MQNRFRQRGISAVEFAIVGSVLAILLLAILQFGRMVYTMNVMQEGARRAARVAAVSPMHANVRDVALFATPPDPLKTTVTTEYWTEGFAGKTDVFDQVRYVRVTVSTQGFNVGIPWVGGLFQPPPASATLPRESLGVVPCGD